MNKTDIGFGGQCPFFIANKSFIFIIGFMCSGKSTLGEQLSADFSIQHIDLDVLFEKHHKISISDYFTKFGEKIFRLEETAILQTIVTNQRQPAILSTGGGVILAQTNANLMKSNGSIVFLDTPWEVISKRLINKNNKKTRPLLTKK